MKHLEPQALRASKPVARKRNPTATFLVLAAALIFGGGALMTSLFGGVAGDLISDSQKSSLQASYAATQHYQLQAVPAAEIDTALQTMKLGPAEQAALKSGLTASTPGTPAGNTLAWLELWDFASEDGDVVHISSAGYEMDYTILNNSVRLAIPVDASATVKVTGVHDGGGGITLAMKSGAMGVSMPILSPGQTLLVPVTF